MHGDHYGGFVPKDPLQGSGSWGANGPFRAHNQDRQSAIASEPSKAPDGDDNGPGRSRHHPPTTSKKTPVLRLLT